MVETKCMCPTRTTDPVIFVKKIMSGAAKSLTRPVIKPVSPGCPVEVFRWGGQADHHLDETLHSHPFDEIMLIRTGGGEHKIGRETFPVSSGTVHFLPAGKPHHLNRTSTCDGGTVIFLREHIINEPLLPFKQLDFLRNEISVLHLNKDVFAEIWLLYEHLLFEAGRPSHEYRKPLILSWLNVLLVKIAAAYKLNMNPASGTSPKHPAVIKFLEILDRHFTRQKAVAFYAKALYVSPQYLHELCVRDTGRGPQETIANRVASEALALLSIGELTVKQVAHRLGFEDPAYFSRFLKKQTGKTPAEWKL